MQYQQHPPDADRRLEPSGAQASPRTALACPLQHASGTPSAVPYIRTSPRPAVRGVRRDKERRQGRCCRAPKERPAVQLLATR